MPTFIYLTLMKLQHRSYFQKIPIKHQLGYCQHLLQNSIFKTHSIYQRFSLPCLLPPITINLMKSSPLVGISTKLGAINGGGTSPNRKKGSNNKSYFDSKNKN